jgi:hypothetical protein
MLPHLAVLSQLHRLPALSRLLSKRLQSVLLQVWAHLVQQQQQQATTAGTPRLPLRGTQAHAPETLLLADLC